MRSYNLQSRTLINAFVNASIDLTVILISFLHTTKKTFGFITRSLNLISFKEIPALFLKVIHELFQNRVLSLQILSNLITFQMNCQPIRDQAFEFELTTIKDLLNVYKVLLQFMEFFIVNGLQSRI